VDTLCGLGLPELLVLAVVGFVVIGPQRSRELALTLGRWLRKLMMSAWWREFNDVAGALRDLPNTLVRMADLEDEVRRVQDDLNKATNPDLLMNPPKAASMPPSENPWGVPQEPNKPDESADVTGAPNE
jgi:Sec-independent protein translocase protein TatA